MIVLDANVLIAHLDQNDAHHSLATERLVSVADQPFGASSITLAEVLVAPVRVGRVREAQAALQALGVAELTFPANAAERLATLRSETALKLPDCCVLLAAEHVRGVVLTFDEQLARAAAHLGLVMSRVEEVVRRAIQELRPLALEYRWRGQGLRTVQPHVLYRVADGQVYVDTYQTDGYTSPDKLLPGWRAFDLAQIVAVELLDESFAPVADYKPAAAKYAGGILASV